MWSPPQDLPRTGPIAIEIVLKVIQNPAPFQNRDSIGNPARRGSLVPLRRCKWFFPASLVPRRLILSCLPGAFQAVQMVLSCLPGASPASLVPPRLSKWFVPTSWCLAGCPMDPFLPPWCLAGAFKRQSCAASLCYERALKGNPVLREGF